MGYYLERIGQAIITFWAAITITFILYRLMPGGPVESMRNQLMEEAAMEGGEIDMDRINRLVELHTGVNPDQPIHIAYVDYLMDIVLYQDFGRSIWRNEPVFDVLWAGMPWSVFVSFYGLLLGFTANVLLGALMAWWENTRFDNWSSIIATFLNSVPYYVGAILFLAVFAFQLGVLPRGGRYNEHLDPGFHLPFMFSVIEHGILPIATGFIVGFGGGALAMRGNSIRILGSDYLRVAQLRGVSTARIATRYVTRNAILPLYTGLMIGISAIFSSSIIMELIFTYPGVGWYTWGALEGRDYPLLMGIFLFYTFVTILGILIADLTYGYIDPRAGTEGRQEAY